MKTRLLILIFILLQLSLRTKASDIYYVDNSHGNDLNNGKTKTTAWKSLGKLNAVIFKPGDKIYLKRGQSYIGNLFLHGSGKAGYPVIISSYGEGKRPQIITGNNEAAIKLLDAAYWEISDLETQGGDKAGIYIGCTKDNLVLNHLTISNCYVHDIGDSSKLGWDEYSKTTGGIIVANSAFSNHGEPVSYNSVFNDVVIDKCIVRYDYRWNGISISSGKINNKGGNTNFIKNCIVEYTSADGIRMNGVTNSIIEFCVMYRCGAWPKENGRNLGGLGAWFFDAENCTIQYCEAGYTRTTSSDGGAFDIDYWQKNSTIQYCYGHHCAGYGVSIFGADPSFPTSNSTIQYNILVDNGQDSMFANLGDFYIFTWNGGLLNGVNIHHNLSISDPVLPAPSLKFNAFFTGEKPNRFSDNIIYSKQSWLVDCRSDSLKCDSNMYWSGSGKPQWTNPQVKSNSLADWQKNTGQEMKSRYQQVKHQTPSWYRFDHTIKNGKHDIGTKAPNFNIDLSAYKGKTILICFINSQNLLKGDDDQKMFSQLLFIKSMKRQYEEKGLKIILVDASQIKNKYQLTNIKNDYELNAIQYISDNAGSNISSKYGVSDVPSTFLISKDGTIKNRWDWMVLPAELAFDIENDFF